MTTPSTERKAGPLLGTGAQTTWPFTFKVFAATDIAVTIADSLGVETTLTYGVHYTVTLNTNQETSPGGTVTYPISGSPLPVGSRLVIVGNLPYDQPLDLPAGGNFSPLALENQLDRTVMQIQQLAEKTSRALQVSITTDADVTLPPPAASQLIGWDSTGENLENVPLSELGTAIAYGTYRYDTFSGDGTTTNYALSEDPAVLANLDVSISGVVQVPGTDYSLVNGSLVFASAPANGTTILARYGQALTALPDSDQITFVQAGAGAVTRTVQNKLRESVSVLDFGADPTGGTDSSSAIQAALNSGKNVSFGKGTFRVESTLVVTNKTIRIELDGATINSTVTPAFDFSGVSTYVELVGNGGRLNYLGSGTAPLIKVDNVLATNNVKWGFIDDLRIDGNNACAGVLISWAHNGSIRDCYMTNMVGYGIRMSFGWDNIIEGNSIQNLDANGSCVILDVSSGVRVQNNRLDSVLGYGVNFDTANGASNGVTVIGNVIESNAVGVNFPTSVGFSMFTLSIVNNFFENNTTYPILVGAGAGSAVASVIVTGNEFAAINGTIQFLNVGGLSLFGNNFACPVLIGAQSGNVVTGGNYIANPANYTVNTQSIFEIDPNTLRTGNNGELYLLGNSFTPFDSSTPGRLHLQTGAMGQIACRHTAAPAGEYWRVGQDGAGNFAVYNQAGTFTGAYLANGATTWSSTSDERVKTVIEPINGALAKVGQLTPVIGRYNHDQEGTRRSFLIAQQVLQAFPEAVNFNKETELYGVQYTDVVPLLVSAINELKAEFDAYKALHP